MPSTLTIAVFVLSLSSMPGTSAEIGKWNSLLVDQEIFQIPLSLDQKNLPESMCGFFGVLQTHYRKPNISDRTILNNFLIDIYVSSHNNVYMVDRLKIHKIR